MEYKAVDISKNTTEEITEWRDSLVEMTPIMEMLAMFGDKDAVRLVPLGKIAIKLANEELSRRGV